MRILQINKFYFPARGADRYYFNLIKLLEDHGQTVIPFAGADVRNYPSPYQDYFAGHIDVSRPDYSWRSLKKIGRIIYNKEAQADLAELIVKTHPEVVHIHNIYHHLSPAILPVCKHFGLPVVMTIHDFQLLSPNYNLFRNGHPDECAKPDHYWRALPHRCVKHSFGATAVSVLEHYYHRHFQTYQKNVDIFIAPSQFVKQKFLEWRYPAAGKIEVVPHFYPNWPEIKALKPKNYLLFIAALESGKGLEELIKTLYSEKLNIDLHVVGDGPERQRLEALVIKLNLDQQVKFLGQLDEGDLRAELRACNLVVVPSKQYETFGLVVLDAFAAQKAVLVSDQGALPEIVTGDVGRIFHAYQKDSLGEQLRAMLNNKESLVAMGKNGYQLLKEKYSAEAHYERMIEIYNRISKP